MDIPLTFEIEDDILENDNINEVICPICKENCFIEINDYKINLSGCKNEHNINNILFKDYQNSQIMPNIKKNAIYAKIIYIIMIFIIVPNAILIFALNVN